MNLQRLFGWGLTIYAIVYLVWSALVVNGLSNTVVARALMLGTLIAVVTIATRHLRVATERDGIPYALGWVLIVAVLDAVFAVPHSGLALYADWNVWVGYLLVLFVPLIVITTTKKRFHSA